MSDSKPLLPGPGEASLAATAAPAPIKAPNSYVHRLRLAELEQRRAHTAAIDRMGNGHVKHAAQVARVAAVLEAHAPALGRTASALEGFKPVFERIAVAAEHDGDVEPASRAAVLVVRCLGLAQDAVLDQRNPSAETTNANLAKAVGTKCWGAAIDYLASVDDDLADAFKRAFGGDFTDEAYETQVAARLAHIVHLAQRIVTEVDDGDGLDTLEKICGRRTGARGVG